MIITIALVTFLVTSHFNEVAARGLRFAPNSRQRRDTEIDAVDNKRPIDMSEHPDRPLHLSDATGSASKVKRAATAAKATMNPAYLAASPYKRVCYYTNWAQYRPAPGAYTAGNIEPGLCTHIIYAFATLTATTPRQLAFIETNDQTMINTINAMKTQQPNLIQMIAVGGWNMASLPFVDIVATSATRAAFIANAIQFLRNASLDGLDIDWEYPADRGSTAPDKQRYTLFLKELKQGFLNESAVTGRPALLLSAAVSAGSTTINNGYEVANISQWLDFINLMSYDLHGSWEWKNGINAPLYGRASEAGSWVQELNVNWAVNYWLSLGAPKQKLMVGVPTYGRTYTYCGTFTYGLDQTTCGGGIAGQATQSSGFLAYYEICSYIRQGWVRMWQSEQDVPWAYTNGSNQFVGHDDVQSVQMKAEYVKANQLGGIMFWAVDLDDFSDICGMGVTYPLLRRATETLLNLTVTQFPPQSAWTAPKIPAPVLTPVSGNSSTSNTSTGIDLSKCDNNCAVAGIYCAPDNKQAFYQCVWGVRYPYQYCQGGLYFSPENKWCDYPQNIKTVCTCGNVTVATTTTTTTTAATATAGATTKATTASGFVCPSANGFFPDPLNCQYYYWCVGGVIYHKNCPAGLYWNPAATACDWPANVKC